MRAGRLQEEDESLDDDLPVHDDAPFMSQTGVRGGACLHAACTPPQSPTLTKSAQPAKSPPPLQPPTLTKSVQPVWFPPPLRPPTLTKSVQPAWSPPPLWPPLASHSAIPALAFIGGASRSVCSPLTYDVFVTPEQVVPLSLPAMPTMLVTDP